MPDIETTATDASGDNPRRLAHDLNNAMASIIGSVDLANLKVPADDPARRYLEQIGSSVSVLWILNSLEKLRSSKIFAILSGSAERRTSPPCFLSAALAPTMMPSPALAM